jgi:hypothetical protein
MPAADASALEKLPPEEALSMLQQQNEQLQAKLFEARHAEEENSRLRKQIQRLSSAGDDSGAASLEQQQAADQTAKLERVSDHGTSHEDVCTVHMHLHWHSLGVNTGSYCSCAWQANATLKAKVDILRSNLAEVRGQAQRSEQLEAELKELSAKLAQAEAAVSAAGESADKLTDSTTAGEDPSVTTSGEDVAALKQRLHEAEAKMAAAAGEADEAQQWQADETAELQAKLKKVEARLAAATSEAEVGLPLIESRCCAAGCNHAKAGLIMRLCRTQAAQTAQDAAAAGLQQRLAAAEGRLASVFDEAEAEHRRQTEVLQQRLADAEKQLASSNNDGQVSWHSGFCTHIFDALTAPLL